MAIQPKLFLPDELLGGMNPDELAFAMTNIEKIRHEGVTTLLVEHNMEMMDIVDRVMVINSGMKTPKGTLVKHSETINPWQRPTLEWKTMHREHGTRARCA